jgi:hypothetical protein
MAIFNLSAVADRARYLESQGMSQEEAEKKAFGESSFNREQMSEQMYSEYQRLYNNEHSKTEMQGDRERLIDRLNAGTNETYDTNPQTPTERNQTTQEPTKTTKQNKG